MEEKRPPIKSFTDLKVYQLLIKATKLVILEIVPRLPKEERFDLGDQMRRACKAAPAILAEGYAKKYLVKSWKKYLHDSLGECNEMIVHLTITKEVYGDRYMPKQLETAIDYYDQSTKMLYTLAKNWQSFKD